MSLYNVPFSRPSLTNSLFWRSSRAYLQWCEAQETSIFLMRLSIFESSFKAAWRHQQFLAKMKRTLMLSIIVQKSTDKAFGMFAINCQLLRSLRTIHAVTYGGLRHAPWNYPIGFACRCIESMVGSGLANRRRRDLWLHTIGISPNLLPERAAPVIRCVLQESK